MYRLKPGQEPLTVLTFFRGPYDFWWKLTFFLWLRKTPFQKDNIFWKIVIIFLPASLGPRRLGALPPHHIFPKATAIVIKQFRKADKKLYKNLPSYSQLSETFLWLRNRFLKYIYPVRNILWNRFLLFMKNLWKVSSFRNNFSLTAPKMPSLI